jgi:hypothetical protein
LGGGGNGGGYAGTANTGGGGGGGTSGNGGNGGSGIVVISYPTGLLSASATGTYAFTQVAGYDIWKFTGGGTWTPTISGTTALYVNSAVSGTFVIHAVNSGDVNSITISNGVITSVGTQ